MRLTVTCLIPAWNEAARIPAVLAAVVGHPLVDQVIVIDDGSGDATARVAADHGATVIVQPVNGGKSAAIARGIAAASGQVLLLLDADLSGLTADHISALLAPVLAGQAAASVSLRQNAPWPWRWIGIDYISGERVMPRGLLAAELPRIRDLRGFGLEVFINDLWLSARLPIAVVAWPGVASPTKARKQGFWRGLRADLGMMADICRTIPPHHMLRQILCLRQRRVGQGGLAPRRRAAPLR